MSIELFESPEFKCQICLEFLGHYGGIVTLKQCSHSFCSGCIEKGKAQPVEFCSDLTSDHCTGITIFDEELLHSQAVTNYSLTMGKNLPRGHRACPLCNAFYNVDPENRKELGYGMNHVFTDFAAKARAAFRSLQEKEEHDAGTSAQVQHPSQPEQLQDAATSAEVQSPSEPHGFWVKDPEGNVFVNPEKTLR